MSIKTKVIKKMTTSELYELNTRLALERDIETSILNLRRQHGEKWGHDNPPKIDTKTPIGKLYPVPLDFSLKTISQLTDEEARQLIRRFRAEEETGRLILDLKINGGEKWDYDNPPIIDTTKAVGTLYHHGIKGQRWGVRRYQNEDGSLTAAGRKQLKNIGGAAKETSKALNELNRIGTGPKSKTIRKDYSDISDADLQKRVNRLNLEQNYGRLTGDTKMVRSGSEWTREILQDATIAASLVGSAVGIYLALKK